jgi:peptidyl-prolyl cis-trans isomerase A (cyclophilin A)
MIAAALLIAAATAAQPVDVALDTTAGTIVVRLDTEHAPVTTANFLRHVRAHDYDGATFYRTVNKRAEPQSNIEVIQGGLGDRAATMPTIPIEPTSKTGLHNDDGAIAMARTSNPNSASTEFFIDVGNDRFLDADGPLPPGYAVFGHVVKGMSVVHAIHDAPATGESLTTPIRILHAHVIP